MKKSPTTKKASLSVQLYTPHEKQKEVHTACNDSETRYIVVNAGRQSGKSCLAQNQAMVWALSAPNLKVWIVSPSEQQCTKMYEDIHKGLVGTPLLHSSKGSKGNIEINLSNGTKVEFKSSMARDNLRGSSVDYLIVDEAAYVDEGIINEVLLPTTNVKGKKVLFISTPRGKTNWFFTYFEKGLRGEHKGIKSFKFTSMDNPLANLEQIGMAKSMLTPLQFAQEYLAEFCDGAAVFNNVTQCVNDSPEHTSHYYAGIDIGIVKDSTVITIINNKHQVVDIQRFTNLGTPELKRNIKATLDFWKPRKSFVETNNQGITIYQDLVGPDYKVQNLEPFITHNKSKEQIINNLINAFNEKKISIPNNKVLLDELDSFIFSFSKTGKIQYQAASGHDDHVMSLAFAYEALLKNISKSEWDYELFIV